MPRYQQAKCERLKISPHLTYVATLPYETLMLAKQAVNDKLQGSVTSFTRSSAIAEGPRDASFQLKYCQLPRNSAETTYTTSPDQIDGMKLEI